MGLFSSFFFCDSSLASKQILDEDIFVFRVVDEIYTLKELELFYNELEVLKCILPESITMAVLNIPFEKEFKNYFKNRPSKKIKFAVNQKFLFNLLKKSIKLKIYVESQRVKFSGQLENAFYTAATEQGCSKKIFTAKRKFSKSFAEILKIEIFLKGRYLNEKSKGVNEVKKLRVAKAKTSILLLLESIEKQINDEVYWN